MRYVFRRHLFLLIGLFTLGLFFLVEVLNRAGKCETANVLAGPMRVLIVPMYVVWVMITMAQALISGPGDLPGPFRAVLFGMKLAAGLAPYAFADYIFHRWRQTATPKVSPSDNLDSLDARLGGSRKRGRSEEDSAE
jgi:hypothetical protein